VNGNHKHNKYLIK